MGVWITADDYGLASGVNEGIERLAARGSITAVSVMMHRDAELTTLDALRPSPVALGPHLVFVEELPLLPRHALEPLLDHEGRLPRSYRALFRKLLLRPRLVELLRDEAEAQIDRYLALGLPIDLINSHQHVHQFPLLWRALSPLFRKHSGAMVRLGGASGSRWSKQGALDFSAYLARRLAPPLGQVTLQPLGVSYAGHLTLARASVALDAWRRACARPMASSSAELVVHPGLEAPALMLRYGWWGYRWQREYELLASGSLQRLLQGRGLRLERRR